MKERVSISKIELIKLRKEQYYTIPEIAKHFNISPSSARSALIAAGLDTSTKGLQRIQFNLTD